VQPRQGLYHDGREEVKGSPPASNAGSGCYKRWHPVNVARGKIVATCSGISASWLPSASGKRGIRGGFPAGAPALIDLWQRLEGVYLIAGLEQ